MVCVAIAALLLYLGRFFGDRLFFGLLPVLTLLMARGYRSLKPPGHRFTPRDQIMVGLSGLAVLAPAVALRLAWMMGPAASTAEHVKGFFIVLAAGVAPLTIFLFCTLLWRLSDANPSFRSTDATGSALDASQTPDETTRAS
jgi:hypothetical protein